MPALSGSIRISDGVEEKNSTASGVLSKPVRLNPFNVVNEKYGYDDKTKNLATFTVILGALTLILVVSAQLHARRDLVYSQNTRGSRVSPHGREIVKRNVLPAPSSDSTRILPPCRSTIFRQMASPIPVPGYSSCV